MTLLANNYAAANSEAPGSAMGRFTGIFFAVFQVNTVVGNLIGAFVLSRHHNQNTLFIIFLVIAGAGVALIFLLIKPAAHNAAALAQAEKEAKRETLMTKILSAFLLLGSREMLLCVPTMFFSGIQAGASPVTRTAGRCRCAQ